MTDENKNRRLAPWRERLHEVIFEADTTTGKGFDVILLITIALSVAVVVLESVESIRLAHGRLLQITEWTFTILFTIEYVVRLISVRRPWRYILSFYGLVDLAAIAPTYLSLFLAGAQSLMVVRALRLLRIFRVFKAARYLREIQALVRAVKATGTKITVFLFTVLTLVLVMGTLMYVVEGEAAGFTSIPRGMYWAIVTVTTVGYGDITPTTVPGQALAAAAMILGYSLIIIPTGIFSMEIVRASQRQITTQSCPACVREGHDTDADYCKYCGASL